jgi:hypothetical protein
VFIFVISGGVSTADAVPAHLVLASPAVIAASIIKKDPHQVDTVVF